MEEIIRKYALYNLWKYGEMIPGKILARVMGNEPELRKRVDEVRGHVDAAIEMLKGTSQEVAEEMLKEEAPELLEETNEKKQGLKELPDIDKERHVVLRFEPSPSGPLHIGHAYVLGLNLLYAQRYNGKMILRIADTNAGTIYEPSYHLLPRDAQWLGRIDDVVIQSDRLDLYYEKALELLDVGGAYICECSSEDFRELMKSKEACPCRNLPPEHHVKRWHKMFDGYEQGDAVMRVKTDIKHPNPAMRDFPVFRINEDPHPRQERKYRVWPLMNFAVAIDDADLGVTHVLRAKDHADNAKRQEYIYNYLDLPIPTTQFVGKINFKGMKLSTTGVPSCFAEKRVSA